MLFFFSPRLRTSNSAQEDVGFAVSKRVEILAYVKVRERIEEPPGEVVIDSVVVHLSCFFVFQAAIGHVYMATLVVIVLLIRPGLCFFFKFKYNCF